jgi:hypothetical protein
VGDFDACAILTRVRPIPQNAQRADGDEFINVNISKDWICQRETQHQGCSLPDLPVSDNASAPWQDPQEPKEKRPFSAAELKEKGLVKV